MEYLLHKTAVLFLHCHFLLIENKDIKLEGFVKTF